MFQLIREGRIDSIPASYAVYRHERVGTEVFHLATEEANKSFAVQFRTLPYSDNGICHVLEHAVLTGSRKFDVKEPFAKLLKGSLNTFLNAMTFSDKTVYPFATTNEQEYLNLLEIYLDGVFHPNIYKDPLILAQEGHHLEITEDGRLEHVGVVYNEMKGVMAQPEQRLFQGLQSALFDNLYGLNSGGDPAVVTSLTQDELLAFHSRYYHPSNAKMMLVGQLDLEAVLAKIDAFVSEFEPAEVDRSIPFTEPFTSLKKVEIPYAVAQRGEQQAILGLAFAQGRYDALEQNMALKLLTNILFMMENSPLRNVLLDSGLAQDLLANFEDSLQQPMMAVMCRGVNAEDVDLIREAMFMEFERLVQEGIPAELKAGALNQWRFALQEGLDGGFMPQGLLFALDGLSHWDRGVDPAAKLDYRGLIDQVEAKLEAGLLEELLQREFIENKHCAQVLMTPSEKLLEREKERELEQMAERLAALSKEEKEEIHTQQKALRQRQNTPDDPEKLKALPSLSQSDLQREVQEHPYELVESRSFPGQKIIQIAAPDDGISYLQLAFPLPELSPREWGQLNFLTLCLGALDTEQNKFYELSNKLSIETGGIFAAPALYDEPTGLRAYVQVTAKALTKKMPDAMDLLGEIIYKTQFSDPDRLKMLFMTQVAEAEMIQLSQPEQLANERLCSYFSEYYAVSDHLFGLAAYRQAKAWATSPTLGAEFCQELSALLAKLFRSSEVRIAYRGPELKATLTKLQSILAPYLGTQEGDGRTLLPFQEEAKNEMFILPMDVSYIAQGYEFKKLGQELTGALVLSQKLLETDFLWEQVRVRGGAYGCNVHMSRSGEVTFVSYRDPKVQATLDAYQRIPEYLENIEEHVPSLETYIISTIGDFDRPLSASQIADRVIRNVHTGRTVADEQRLRNEILDATPSDIAALAPLFQEILAQDMRCAVGSQRLASEGKDLFHKTEI